VSKHKIRTKTLERSKGSIFGPLASNERADGKADKIRPENNGQHPVPESEVEESDREKPPRKPGKRREAMVFDFYLFHKTIISIGHSRVY